jgi:GH24 family phage-related lysozyme (muramidase)
MDLAAQLISEEEGPSSPTVYLIDGLAHIGRGVCVDASVPGVGLPPNVLALLDATALAAAETEAGDIPGYSDCNPVRQAVIVSMCYQLGTLADWPIFRTALVNGNYGAAADAMMASRWATETPQRAKRESDMMRSGNWIENATE